MRFQCFKPNTKKHIKSHKWFAWFPVGLTDENATCVWLEYVEREQWFEPDSDGIWGWFTQHRSLDTNLETQ